MIHSIQSRNLRFGLLGGMGTAVVGGLNSLPGVVGRLVLGGGEPRILTLRIH